MGKEEEKQDKINDDDRKNDKGIVLITVDGHSKKVLRGNYSLSEFKKLVGVAENLDIDEVVNGKFIPLNESKEVHIKGGEIFVSHVKTGSSS